MSALGLSTYRWNNNLKSVILLGLFPVLLAGLVFGCLYLYGWSAIDPTSGQVFSVLFSETGRRPVLGDGQPLDFALTALEAWWPLILGAAIIWLLIGFAFNDTLIHAATGARPVTRTEAPKLYNLLENLCISRGMKMPNLYIIDGDEMNAYASGINASSFAITVTQGIVDRLSDDEMEAVLAHELTHILNRDCRLMMITIVFVGMISFVAQMIWRGVSYASYGRNRDREGGGGFIFMIFASVLFAVGYCLAVLLRLAISRKREYLADAGSVELTKNPDALIGALRKISANPDIPHVPSEVRQMFIENPPSVFDVGGLFSTHPPIEDRIHVLEELGGLPHAGKSLIPDS